MEGNVHVCILQEQDGVKETEADEVKVFIFVWNHL